MLAEHARDPDMRHRATLALDAMLLDFSHYLQHQGTLLGLCAVPAQVEVRNRIFDYPYFKLYAPFSTTGSIVKRIEKSGWVFCHNGTMLMAFFSAESCDGHLKVDGSPVVFSQKLLHQNPLVRQKTGGPLIIQYQGRRLTYDFANWTRTESAASGKPSERP